MSQIPAVLDALYGRLAAAPALSEVTVTDGPLVSDSRAPDWVLVGFDGDAEGAFEAATADEDWSSLGLGRSERISVPITLIASSGDTDVRTVRNRVFQMAAAVRQVLADDPSLGLNSAQCAVQSSTLQQPQTDQGATARLTLSLLCEIP
ncbi:hypothetical protein [Streptomyces lycii]|uniref:DUF3168 domain-containing protein n=1 Tax=Streptomyces lycii TaxID=2654337 RepID=A0ABQ7FIA8_9ACTN|nr:hypothetical protein [Streptomyces lycii]KAF4408657.1 hypothetical protein GCU69_13245 [Streptomyces lycii]